MHRDKINKIETIIHHNRNAEQKGKVNTIILYKQNKQVKYYLL